MDDKAYETAFKASQKNLCGLDIEDSVHKRMSNSVSQKTSREEELISKMNDCELDSIGDSTYSLLSPIYHDSFDSEDVEEAFEALNQKDEGIQKNKVVLRTKSLNAKPENIKKQQQLPLTEFNFTPWEEWLIRKTKEERNKIQNRSMKEVELQQEKLKELQEVEKKHLMTEEKLRNWIRKKNEKERIEKEMRLRKELEEKKATEEKKRQAQEKSEQKYQEWLQKKKAEECEKKRKEQEEKERQSAELSEKKKKAEECFQNWLKNAKTKHRPVLNSFGYANGKLTGYYDWSSYPAPSFYNPIPWKPIHVPSSEEQSRKFSKKKGRKPVSSLLYRTSSAVICRPKDNLSVRTHHRNRKCSGF